jgi:hypothetical protein
MSGVIYGKFHLDVIFLVGIFFSIDFNNVFLNRVQFSSIDFPHRFSDSNIVQRSSMSFFTFSIFPFLCKKVKDAIQEAHRKYFDDILNTSITDNPKKFYSYIKQKKSGQSNIPVLKRNTEILSEPKDKANVLNDQYTSVFTREPPGQLPDIDDTPIPPMTDIEFTSPGVEKLLQNLNPNKAAGPDFLPTRMLKMVAKEIAPVLAFIFQQSYDTSQVPSDWQLANVTAVFKKGDKTIKSS